MNIKLTNKPTCDCEVFVRDLGDDIEKHYSPCEKHKKMLDELCEIDIMFDKMISFHIHMEDFSKEA